MLSGKISSSFFWSFLFLSSMLIRCCCMLLKIKLQLTIPSKSFFFLQTFRLFSVIEFFQRLHVSIVLTPLSVHRFYFESPCFRVRLQVNSQKYFLHSPIAFEKKLYHDLTFFVFRHKLRLVLFQSLIFIAQFRNDNIVVDF